MIAFVCVCGLLSVVFHLIDRKVALRRLRFLHGVRETACREETGLMSHGSGAWKDIR